jgi:raffinose/stachyose/melibiose transport system substrate-binding protein
VLKKIGISDPGTLKDKKSLLAAVEKAKSKGTTPVLLGDSEKNWALHNLSLFNGWYVAPEKINDWVYGVKGSTYDDAGHIRAAGDLQDWMKKGYFNSDALSTSFNDALARFSKNESAFFVTGTWALGDLTKKMDKNVGFMLWPAGDSGKHAAVGGYSLPFTLSSKSKYPDCAASLMDFITASPQAIKAQIASGRPSAATAGADYKVSDPVLAQMVANYKQLNADNGLFPWEDWPTPTMLTLAGTKAQLLLRGKTSPKEYSAALQKDWDDYTKSK